MVLSSSRARIAKNDIKEVHGYSPGCFFLSPTCQVLTLATGLSQMQINSQTILGALHSNVLGWLSGEAPDGVEYKGARITRHLRYLLEAALVVPKSH